MASKKLIRNSVAVAAVFGAVIAGGSAIASAQSDSSSTPASASASADAQGGGSGKGGVAPHEHTDVTGDELTNVTNAVTAYDSAITVDSVQKDPDGSYDVHATKDGSQVMLEVSADLQTVTERQGGPGGKGGHGPGGMGQHEHTDVTGDELTQVTDAVTAYDSAITVDSVQKDPDGSYDVHATKDGSQVMLEVSADLQTVTERQGPPAGAGPNGPQSQQGQTDDQSTDDSGSADQSASPSEDGN